MPILWPTGDGWVPMGPGMLLGGPPLGCEWRHLVDALDLCSFSFVWGGDWAVVWRSQRTLMRGGSGVVVARLRTDTRADSGRLGRIRPIVGGNAVAGSLADKLHVLLVTFAGWLCEWAIGGLCDKPGLLFVCSALVENQSSGRGNELAWGVGCGRVNTSSVDEGKTYQRKQIHLDLDVE